jgi:signal transduction histidine kinase
MIFWKIIFKNVKKKMDEAQAAAESDFHQSVKAMYDEHIFSITHELRSPLSVVAASAHNQLNDLRNLYNTLQDKLSKDDQELTKQCVINIKKTIKTVQDQIEIMENFISNIAEHGSYVHNTNDKFLNIYQYMYSVLMNCSSFSRNMKIFKNNILFGDGFGRDFQNVQVMVNPHDLSRIIMNVVNNSADAVSSHYSEIKASQPDYEPSLRIRCIKTADPTKKLLLKPNIHRINDNAMGSHPFYIVIQDNGPGVSEENMKKIFQMGFSTKKCKNHYGLGLHLVMKLADKNGLAVYLKTSKEGTTFIIGFPKIMMPENLDKIYQTNDSKELFNELVEKEICCCENSEEVLVYFKKEEAGE